MMLPAAWKLIPVTAAYCYVDGTQVQGEVRFSSPRKVVVDGVVIVPSTITAKLDAEGRIALDLPSTNDPDLSATGWAYTVAERFTGGRKPFELAVDFESFGIDLSSTMPTPPPPGPPFVVLHDDMPWHPDTPVAGPPYILVHPEGRP